MIPDKASRAAQKLVDELEQRDINPYISLAKLALWVSSLVYVTVIVFAVVQAIAHRDASQVGNAVGAAQAMTVIALSIMGWHGYRGSQAFYLLRHLGKNKILEHAPDGKDRERAD